MGIIEKGLEALYPSSIYCIFCGSVIDQSRRYALCDHCIKKFHWVGARTCKKCGKLLLEDSRHELCHDCRTFTHYFEKGYTCAQYGLYERGLMMDYKYKGKSYIGRKLGDVLYDRISPEGLQVDLIVPVPMYKKKEYKRGYNQAAIMADKLARHMKVPCVKGLLLRTRKTAPMKGLDPLERQENLRKAFAISPQNQYDIKGKTILLIDDIYTTGSTVDECSKVLTDYGAGKVLVLTFAAGADRKPETSS